MSERIIRVTGKGQIKAKPDMTRVTLTISDTKKEYDKALEASAHDTETIKGILEKQGFTKEDVKTLSFDVDVERHSYRDEEGEWQSEFIGYRYTHILKVEFLSDNERLGRMLHVLAHNAAVRPEFCFSFFVKDVEAQKNALLSNAVTDAKAKAEVLSSAAGVKLGEILSIDYSWGEINLEYSPIRRNMEVPAFLKTSDIAAPRSGGIDIEPDDIEVSDTVTVIWEIVEE